MLSEFFSKSGDAWKHRRIEQEITAVHAKSQKARNAAAVRWQYERNANASPEHGAGISETHPLQTPDTSHQTPEKKPRKRGLPENFGISERVQAWAAEKGHGRLAERLEHFLSYVRRKAPTYADWDEALMTAIREDWAKLGKPPAAAPQKITAPDCKIPGCKREGMPGLGGVCETHYESPRRVAA